MKKQNAALVLLAVVVLSQLVLATVYDENDFALYVWSKAKPILCGIYYTFIMIAGALAAVMIVYAGIKWIGSSDDPGARKSAKETIIHAVVALVIIVVAARIVDLLIAGEKCW